MSKRRSRAARRSPLPALCAVLAVVAVVAVVLVLLLSTAFRSYVQSAFHLPYYEEVMAACERYGVPPSLAYAVIQTESRFDPDAVSGAGAKGLMQLTDATFLWVQSRSEELRDISVSRIFEPGVNIRFGVRTLSLLLEMFGSEDTAVAAYNAGLGNVRNWLSDPNCSDDGETLTAIPFPETRAYLQKVRAAREVYQSYYRIDERMATGEDSAFS